jgi:tetratricopeptide (TPR) repeat protein
MSVKMKFHKHTVAALGLAMVISLTCGAAARAQEGDLDGLFENLKSAPVEQAAGIAEQIEKTWSRSGSAAMDLLLARGRDALEAGEVGAAIGHLGALVDHAPEFAEGYHSRAMAYFAADLYGPALADIQTALRLNPRHFAAMRGLAAILEVTGKPVQALEVYRKVLEIHPGSERALDGVARLTEQVRGVTL